MNISLSPDAPVPAVSSGLDDADFVRLVRAKSFVDDLARTAQDCEFVFDSEANALKIVLP